MNKVTSIVVALAIFLSCFSHASANELKTKKDYVQALEQKDIEIKVLKRELLKKDIEIKRLKELCSKNRMQITEEKSAPIQKEEFRKSDKPMFGVFLGESVDSLRKRFEVSESNWSFDDKDHPAVIYNVQNNNSNVKELLVYIFNDKVYQAKIFLTDSSRVNYDTITGQLEKKYKTKDEGGFSGALFGEGIFETMIDGVKVRIKLNHDIGFMKDDTLELTYTHKPLSDELYKEIQRRKASKISGDL